jgi:chromate transporter
MSDPETPVRNVSLAKATRYWLRLGMINFGGPAGQISIMHDDLVSRRGWIGHGRFLHALNYCMLLPGPEAQQLAIYIGWLLNGTLGGLIAGVLFVLPGAIVMLGLAWTFAVHGEVDWVAAIFYGLRAAVIAIVAIAVVRIGKRALRNPVMVSIAIAAFAAIFFLRVPFPFIIIAAGLIGFFGSRRRPEFFVTSAGRVEEDDDAVIAGDTPAAARPTLKRSLKVLAIGLAVWWGPLFVVGVLRGIDDVLSREAVFFSTVAMVTFGGAYAVLAYINQAAVEQFGWLEPGQMITGLGLAESTPGPLILVTQFVGFLGAYRLAGDLDPTVAGTLGAAVTLWAVFAPSFLWIFLGAPFIEHLRGNVRLAGALSTVTAAVVGVIANLAVWFGIHTLFTEVVQRTAFWITAPVPEPTSADAFPFLVAAVVGYGMWRWRWHIVPVVLGSAVAGLVYRALT